MKRALQVLRLLTAAMMTAVVLGCSDPTDKLVGTWQGSANIQRPPTGNTSLDSQFASLKNVVDYSLVLRKDHGYTEKVGPDATFAQGIGANTIEGTWTFDRGTLTLTPKTFNGADPAVEKARSEKMMASLHITLPLPEGTTGPRQAMVSDDFTKITMPSVGTTAELMKIGK